MSELSLVVFDLAGTTIEDHSTVARCLVSALQSIGVSATEHDANTVMGMPKPVAIARLLERAADRREPVDSPRVLEATRVFEQTITRHYGAGGAIVPISGVEDVFETLHEHGARVAIDTGFSSVVTDVILGRLGWLDQGLVDVRVTSDEVEHGRPAPDLVFEAMRRLHVTDARTVAKVGDTPADLREGAAAGCRWIVGVTYGTHARAALVDHPHTALIDDLRELPGVLGLEDRASHPKSTRRSERARV